MSNEILNAFTLLIIQVVAIGLWTYAGFKWGIHSAGEAQQSGSKKYKAYVLALFLPLTLCTFLALEPHLSKWSFSAFWVMASGAAHGVLTGYRRG
jgi:hypothetical protein